MGMAGMAHEKSCVSLQYIPSKVKRQTLSPGISGGFCLGVVPG